MRKLLLFLRTLFRKNLTRHETVPLLDGEPITERIRSEGGRRYTVHEHQCCDCGLTHRVMVSLGKSTLTFQYWRKGE